MALFCQVMEARLRGSAEGLGWGSISHTIKNGRPEGRFCGSKKKKKLIYYASTILRIP